MTAEEIDAAVEHIKLIAGDDEAAHVAEDALLKSTLRAIADGAPEPHVLAALALQSDQVEFARWCA